jgi:hypothetical protein
MCSQYAIPTNLYKLTVNFNEGISTGHRICGTKCPGTLALHVLQLTS